MISISKVCLLSVLVFMVGAISVNAQVVAPEKYKSIALKILPQANAVFVEADSILQVSIDSKRNFTKEAKLICENLKSKGDKEISIVFVENGDTGLGKCNCKTLQTGFQPVADRKYGYYYFAK